MVSAGTALSRVFGLVREQVMAYYFGAGMATDAFVAAFRIPNLLRDMFAEGALSSAFVPVFKEKLTLQSESEAFALARVVVTAILMVVGLIVLLGIIAAPGVVYLMAHGFTADPQKFDLTVGLTRLMMVYLLLVSLSALVMGMLNSLGRFGIPSLAPAAFNVRYGDRGADWRCDSTGGSVTILVENRIQVQTGFRPAQRRSEKGRSIDRADDSRNVGRANQYPAEYAFGFILNGRVHLLPELLFSPNAFPSGRLCRGPGNGSPSEGVGDGRPR